MSVDESGTLPSGLSDLLGRVAYLREEKAAAEAVVKKIGEELDKNERLAVEALGVSGLDGCRVAGRTWWMQEELRLSISADARERVMKAAKKHGIAAEITTIATATLKSWLKEQAQARGRERGQSFVEGTAFKGLVTEFVEPTLRSRAM
ncbi:hypothetical protein UFOVP1423_31 [uncultured Caudovirales phage]|uniref:Uncharacterized protein n=2 Tax=uncultured Caudovirales phage TaxID=2100421 RepID=A0A6J5QAX1_9CAUD|nr:hypothetical protein UFOVP985_58 [uncultured Caudovirales phage]CAB4181887.1 hypothetical protein UFOVP1073_73 [uncultured Caudovirales phage]CAB4197897.1 hypothetical protein UFOVP1308_38 [uncultured Caudovirales phage]CAB4210595.1 hypothetical protein UFOVP1423_31 [uncultured Caudovirales phage]CAB5227044.1 hypothetical protein UFOVP1520_2 [uncultured Caudovirales phage]